MSDFIKVDPSELVPWAHVKVHDLKPSQWDANSNNLAYCSNPGQGRSRKSITTFNIYINKDMVFDLVEQNEYLKRVGARNLYVALLLHEIGHIRYGSFVTALRNLTQVQFWVFNLLEDSRIEYHMGYDFTNLAPFLRLMNSITKCHADAEINVKTGLYSSEREILIRMLNALFDFVRFGLLPTGAEEQELVAFAFPFILTAERGGVADAVNSAIAIATKIDGMLISLALAGSREMHKLEGSTASTSKNGLTIIGSEAMEDEDFDFFGTGVNMQPVAVPMNIGEGFEDHDGSVVYNPTDASPVTEDGRPDMGEGELEDTFEEYDDSDSPVEEVENRHIDPNIQMEIDLGSGVENPLYDPLLKNTPTPSIAPATLMNDDYLYGLMDRINDQQEEGSTFIDEMRRDFYSDIKDAVETNKTVIRLPGQTSLSWENSMQSKQIDGGSGTDMEILIVGESNESFFYRATVEERISTVSKMRHTMRTMFREPSVEDSFEGDLNPVKQQSAYMSSLFGEENRDYNVRKLTTKSFDIALLRDISGSTMAVKREYAEAVVVFLESLEGIENVQTGLVDFESNFQVTKRFHEPLRSSRIFPVSRGGTQIDGSLDEIKKWNWVGNNRLCVIITDGGLYSRAMDRHIRELSALNIKTVVLGIGYTAPLPGIPLFMTTVEGLPETMGGLVKNYILHGRITPVEVTENGE